MRFVALLHRWLGIFGCLLFIAWFASGIVMIYARMPELAPHERLDRAPVLDLSPATLSPSNAAAKHQLLPQRATVGMLLGRPVYRFQDRSGPVMVFADNGDRFAGFSRDDAMREIDRAYPTEIPAIPAYDARITEPDQWTLQERGQLPMHRVMLRDREQTVVYLSDVSGPGSGPDDSSRAPARVRWCGVALVVFHTATEKWSALEPDDHLAVAGRQRDVCPGIDLGFLRRLAIAIHRMDEVASLCRVDLWRHHLYLGVQRPVVDGSVGLASEHRADARAARRIFRRAVATRASFARGFTRRDSSAACFATERDRDRAVSRRAAADR
jgi:hypothetical protein